MSWEHDLLEDLELAYAGSSAAPWFSDKVDDGPGVHLAIMREPYMSHIVNGAKTIESRWSKNKQAPWGQVAVGDVVVFSRAASDGERGVVGISVVTDVRSIEVGVGLDSSIDAIKHYVGQRLAVPNRFWHDMLGRRYVTLMTLGRFRKPMRGAKPRLGKKDQRGWVVLRRSPQL